MGIWKSAPARESLVEIAKRAVVERPISAYVKEILNELSYCLVGVKPLVDIIWSYARNHGETFTLQSPKSICADFANDKSFFGATLVSKHKILLIVTLEGIRLRHFLRTDKNSWQDDEQYSDTLLIFLQKRNPPIFHCVVETKNGFIEILNPPTEAVLFLGVGYKVDLKMPEVIRRIFQLPYQFKFIGLDGDLIFFSVYKDDVMHVVVLDWVSHEWLPRFIRWIHILEDRERPWYRPAVTLGAGVLFFAIMVVVNQLLILTYCTDKNNFGELVHAYNFNFLEKSFIGLDVLIPATDTVGNGLRVESMAYSHKTDELFATIQCDLDAQGTVIGTCTQVFCLA